MTPILPQVTDFQRFRLCRIPQNFVAIFLGIGLLLASCGQSIVAADRLEKRLELLHKRYDTRWTSFSQAMNALADECEGKSFLSDAARIRNQARPVQDGVYDLDTLPEEVLPSLPLTLPPEEREWRAKLQKLERDYATDLYKIARDALRLGYPTLTYQLVREVAYRDPNNASARSMLGYVQDNGRWTTPFLKRMTIKGMIDHPRFGWIDSKQVSRYENGERFFNGQWMSAEKEGALRSDFKNAWEIGTEHFLVRTNVGLEHGVELSRRLEVYHRFFMSEFAAFFNSAQQIEKLLDVGTRPQWKEANRYRVTFYRNKDEFVNALKSRMPGIEKANGLYLPRDRTAYFYNEAETNGSSSAEDRQETMYHEVTHQLLGESRPGIFDVGEQSDFWVIEGFPCYMESFLPGEHGGRVGDPRHIRIFWARKKIIEEHEYRPMREFIKLGRQNFPLQAEAYNQSAAMVHFFLNAEDGKYQDAFIQYLTLVYNPAKVKKPTLEEIIGIPFEALDREFLEYLKTLPSEPPPGLEIVPFATGTP